MLTVYSLRPYYRVDYDNLGRYAGRDGYYALSPDEDEAATVRTLHFSSVGYPRTFKLDYAVRQEGTANPDVESLTQKIIYVAAGEEQAREFGTGSFAELGDAGGSRAWSSSGVPKWCADASVTSKPRQSSHPIGTCWPTRRWACWNWPVIPLASRSASTTR